MDNLVYQTGDVINTYAYRMNNTGFSGMAILIWIIHIAKIAIILYLVYLVAKALKIYIKNNQNK